MNPTGQIRNTITHLRRCQDARRQGFPVSFTNDPSWLLDMAINRRAGWQDDPSLLRGSAMPINGRYPLKASGDRWTSLRLIAREINTPRLIVRPQRLGEWRAYLTARLPNRLFTEEE